MSLVKRFGEHVRILRKAKGYNQKELAKLYGLQKAAISRLENGMPSKAVEWIIKLGESFERELRFVDPFETLEQGHELTADAKELQANFTGRIYILPSVSSPGAFPEWSSALPTNDAECVRIVERALEKSGYERERDFKVLYQHPRRDVVSSTVRAGNLILVGGPRRSKFVENLFRNYPELLSSVRLDLSPEPAFIRGKTRYVSEDTRDWAVLAVKPNPYNPQRRLVWLFGLGSIGTKGAGSFYARPGWAQAKADIANRLGTFLDETEIFLRVEHTEDRLKITRVEPVAFTSSILKAPAKKK